MENLEPEVSPYEVFKNAPITEAILEIVVDPREGLQIEDLLQFPENIRGRFSRTAQRMEFKGAVKLGAEVSFLPSDQKAVGYLLHSDEDKKVIQSRLDGFAFSKLKPYESWEVFCSEARELWGHYLEIVKARRVKRISLRYINRIEIPLPMRDFSDYFLTNPQIAPGLPQALSGLFMRLEIPEPIIDATAILILALDTLKQSEKLPLIFDIDVLRQTDYSENMHGIWKDFEKLRNFKNEVFFNSVTEKTKELFR